MYSHQRVLIALDGSPDAEAVMKFLMEIAGPLDMTVVLLHVLAPITPVVSESVVVLDDIDGRRRAAEEYLAPIAAALRSQGVEASWAIRQGRPADEILAAARESGADLIAMATHGRTGGGRLLFGSVAEAVLRHASVPLFMIRQAGTIEATSTTRENALR